MVLNEVKYPAIQKFCVCLKYTIRNFVLLKICKCETVVNWINSYQFYYTRKYKLCISWHCLTFITLCICIAMDIIIVILQETFQDTWEYAKCLQFFFPNWKFALNFSVVCAIDSFTCKENSLQCRIFNPWLYRRMRVMQIF